ncbi:dTDP-4-dehydrorhamnose 3,5-epimerase [Planktomarina temperata]|nr:dTDP-4-dehydrorhamnose 3,5-epimerase [Planktomarina temperata]MDA9998766.1 dTDP-4-dehydrorhamnose 3,5-epimerase [Planktomarina temperata]
MSFLKLLVPSRISDNRGFFSESYSRRRYAEMEIGADFVQDNPASMDHKRSNSGARTDVRKKRLR